MCAIGAGGEPPPGIDLSGTRFAAAATTDIDANWKAAAEAFLDDRNWRLVWPAAMVARAEPVTNVVRQIVPRSFLRTRIVDLIFTADGIAADDIIGAQRSRATSDKSAAERRQAAHAAGTAPPPRGRIAEFLQQVIAARAE